jgi:hypothetical protein
MKLAHFLRLLILPVAMLQAHSAFPAEFQVYKGAALKQHLRIGDNYWFYGGCIRGDEKQGLACFGVARARVDGFIREGIPLITLVNGSYKGANNSCLRDHSVAECDDNSPLLKALPGFPLTRGPLSQRDGRLATIKKVDGPYTCVSSRMLDMGHGDYDEDFRAGQDLGDTTSPNYEGSFNHYFNHLDQQEKPKRARRPERDGLLGYADAVAEYAETVADYSKTIASALSDPSCDLHGGEQVIIYGEEEVLYDGFRENTKTMYVGRVVGHVDRYRKQDVLSRYLVYIDPGKVE